MNETTNELVSDIRSQIVGGASNSRTTAELVKEIRDKVADGVTSPSEVAAMIAEVVAGAPEAFDTLKEVSDWITLANNYISYTYNNQSTYNVGDCCLNENILYQCNTAIDTPEDFDSTKWDAVNITELINTLSGRVDLIHGVYHSETETIEFA